MRICTRQSQIKTHFRKQLLAANFRLLLTTILNKFHHFRYRIYRFIIGIQGRIWILKHHLNSRRRLPFQRFRIQQDRSLRGQFQSHQQFSQCAFPRARQTYNGQRFTAMQNIVKPSQRLNLRSLLLIRLPQLANFQYWMIFLQRLHPNTTRHRLNQFFYILMRIYPKHLIPSTLSHANTLSQYRYPFCILLYQIQFMTHP